MIKMIWKCATETLKWVLSFVMAIIASAFIVGFLQ